MMWTVCSCSYSVSSLCRYIFGVNAVVIMTASVVSAVIAEAVMQILMKKKVTISDGSAAVTGLLVALNVPPSAPFWMPAQGLFLQLY